MKLESSTIIEERRNIGASSRLQLFLPARPRMLSAEPAEAAPLLHGGPAFAKRTLRPRLGWKRKGKMSSGTLIATLETLPEPWAAEGRDLVPPLGHDTLQSLGLAEQRPAEGPSLAEAIAKYRGTQSTATSVTGSVHGGSEAASRAPSLHEAISAFNGGPTSAGAPSITAAVESYMARQREAAEATPRRSPRLTGSPKQRCGSGSGSASPKAGSRSPIAKGSPSLARRTVQVKQILQPKSLRPVRFQWPATPNHSASHA